MHPRGRIHFTPTPTPSGLPPARAAPLTAAVQTYRLTPSSRATRHMTHDKAVMLPIALPKASSPPLSNSHINGLLVVVH